MKSNEEMVEYLISIGALKTQRIIEAFLNINRLDFVKPEYAKEAYENYPLPIGYGQTISQPYTVAFMLELLQPKSSDDILDVGCGSGWTTALLAYIADKGSVMGVEIVEQLVEFGKNNLKKYNFKNAKIVHGDKLLSKDQHFDKILVSAAAKEMPNELIDAMKKNARMIVPVNSSIFLVEKKDNELFFDEHYGFSFVRLM